MFDESPNKRENAQPPERPNPKSLTGENCAVDNVFNRHYDLTPLDTDGKDKNPGVKEKDDINTPTTPSYSIDPWEVKSPIDTGREDNESFFQFRVHSR